MPDFKEVVQFLGFDPEKVQSLEDLKTNVEAEFVRKSDKSALEELAKPYIGKRMGGMETAIKKKAKEFAIDLESDEYKGKPVEELFSTTISKMAEVNLKTVKELEAKLGQTNDEALKELQAKFEKEAKTRKEKEDLLAETVNKYKELEQSASNQIRDFKMNVAKKDLWGQLKFKSGIKEIEREGFESYISKNYKIELGEGDKLEIRDSHGNPIPNPKVIGTYRDPIDVLSEELVKNELAELNPHAGKPTSPVIKTPATPTSPSVLVSPRAL